MLLPSLASANGWGPDWFKSLKNKAKETAAARSGEKLVDMKKEMERQMTEAAKKAEEQKVAERRAAEAEAEIQKFAAKFEALKRQFPGEAKLIGQIDGDHAFLVRAAITDISAEKLTHALEYLHEDFVELYRANETAAAEVKKVLNHTYPLLLVGRSRKNLKDVKDEVIRASGGQVVTNDRVYGLQIEGSGWFDTFDAK